MVPASTLMYGSILSSVTWNPRASSSEPIEAAASPFPRDDTTPPVTKMNFGVTRDLLSSPCPSSIRQPPRAPPLSYAPGRRGSDRASGPGPAPRAARAARPPPPRRPPTRAAARPGPRGETTRCDGAPLALPPARPRTPAPPEPAGALPPRDSVAAGPPRRDVAPGRGPRPRRSGPPHRPPRRAGARTDQRRASTDRRAGRGAPAPRYRR